MKHRTLPILMGLLAVTLASGVNAAVIPIPLGPGTTALLGAVPLGSFTDTYAFNLSGPTSISDSFGQVFNIPDFGYSLKDLTTNTTFAGSTSYGVGSGSYEWIFTGVASISNFPAPFGIYFGSYHVAAAAVPELDTWLMLLIGAGLLAYQLRRKQSTLKQSKLASA